MFDFGGTPAAQKWGLQVDEALKKLAQAFKCWMRQSRGANVSILPTAKPGGFSTTTLPFFCPVEPFLPQLTTILLFCPTFAWLLRCCCLLLVCYCCCCCCPSIARQLLLVFAAVVRAVVGLDPMPKRPKQSRTPHVILGWSLMQTPFTFKGPIVRPLKGPGRGQAF